MGGEGSHRQGTGDGFHAGRHLEEHLRRQSLLGRASGIAAGRRFAARPSHGRPLPLAFPFPHPRPCRRRRRVGGLTKWDGDLRGLPKAMRRFILDERLPLNDFTPTFPKRKKTFRLCDGGDRR